MTAEQEGEAAPAPADWPCMGARAVLCQLAKFPQFNGQKVEIAAFNEEKRRWKCLLPKGGDVSVLSQNLAPLELPPAEVQAVERLLEEGRLFEAWQALSGPSAAPQRLRDALEAKLAKGAFAEFPGDRLVAGERGEKEKGGWRAKRDVKKGDVLLFEGSLCHAQMPQGEEGSEGLNVSRGNDPYIEMSRDISRSGVGEEYLNEWVHCLPYMKVTDDKRSVLLRILEHNALWCSREPDRMAFFGRAARLNHCTTPPNAFADCSRKVCVLRALQDIKEGEEVTVSYGPASGEAEKGEEDVTMMVPSPCGKTNFSLASATRMYQTCEYCYATFDREESQHNLSKLREANALARRGGDAAEHMKRLQALEKLVLPGATNGVPPRHPEVLRLYNNLSQLQYHLATRVKGEHAAASLAAFHKYHSKVAAIFEERHGDWGPQHESAYLQVLHASLITPGLPAEKREDFAAKLQAACEACFGQACLPDTLKPRL